MKTAVKVRFKGGGTATFHKTGSKDELCKITTIRIKGKTFRGRRGGRTLCGPSTGKNSPAARAARAAFKRMVKGMKRRRSRSRRRR
jgi:hypothetical protein